MNVSDNSDSISDISIIEEEVTNTSKQTMSAISDLLGKGRNQRQVWDTMRFPMKSWNHFECVKEGPCCTNDDVEALFYT